MQSCKHGSKRSPNINAIKPHTRLATKEAPVLTTRRGLLSPRTPRHQASKALPSDFECSSQTLSRPAHYAKAFIPNTLCAILRWSLHPSFLSVPLLYLSLALFSSVSISISCSSLSSSCFSHRNPTMC